MIMQAIIGIAAVALPLADTATDLAPEAEAAAVPGDILEQNAADSDLEADLMGPDHMGTGDYIQEAGVPDTWERARFRHQNRTVADPKKAARSKVQDKRWFRQADGSPFERMSMPAPSTMGGRIAAETVNSVTPPSGDEGAENIGDDSQPGAVAAGQPSSANTAPAITSQVSAEMIDAAPSLSLDFASKTAPAAAEAVATPLPPSALLFASGIGALGLSRRRSGSRNNGRLLLSKA